MHTLSLFLPKIAISHRIYIIYIEPIIINMANKKDKKRKDALKKKSIIDIYLSEDDRGYPNLRCTERWGVTTFRLSAMVIDCTLIDQQSRNGSRRNKISSASDKWMSSKSLWLPTLGATEIDDSKVGWWIRLRLKRRLRSPYFLSILRQHNITSSTLYL